MDERAKKQLRELKRKKRRQKLLIIKCLFALSIMMFVLLAAYLITKSMPEEPQQDVSVQDVGKTDDTEKENEGTNQELTGDSEGQEAEVTAEPELPDDPDEKLAYYAELHGFSVEDYPERVVNLLKKNAETEEFVLNYPLKRGQYSDESLTELEDAEGIPLLIQWDQRWGYYEYGSDVIGITGCGPTCMSMVASYLFQNPDLTPIYMANYATENGYIVEGGGTTWAMMSTGAEKMGLTVTEVPLYEPTVLKYLEEGHPIICNVGPGYFTDGGHYIVFAGCEDGMIKIHDPNNKEYSATLWDFADIADQIKNMWVYMR